MTSRLEQLTGRSTPINDDQLAAMTDMSQTPSNPYPLGVPLRILDRIDDKVRAAMKKFIEPRVHEVTNLMPSDVPGLLIAAGVSEIYASLHRIEKAHGFESAERAYHAILRRALADGRDDIAQQMTEARQQIICARAARKADTLGAQRLTEKPPGKVAAKIAELQARALAEQREHDERELQQRRDKAAFETTKPLDVDLFSQQLGQLDPKKTFRGVIGYGQY